MQYELKIVFLFLIVINIIEYFAFNMDKNAARSGQRRIPEKTLLLLAIFGGTIGAIIGQQTLRHKTYKQPFKFLLYSIATIQCISLLLLLIPAVREVVLGFLAQIITRPSA